MLQVKAAVTFVYDDVGRHCDALTKWSWVRTNYDNTKYLHSLVR